jgi:hypothetical protein
MQDKEEIICLNKLQLKQANYRPVIENGKQIN